jgi:hypothetical protein
MQGQTLGRSLAHGPKSRGALALAAKNESGKISGRKIWPALRAETVSGPAGRQKQKNGSGCLHRWHRDNKKLAVKQVDQDQNPPPVQERKILRARKSSLNKTAACFCTKAIKRQLDWTEAFLAEIAGEEDNSDNRRRERKLQRL